MLTLVLKYKRVQTEWHLLVLLLSPIWTVCARVQSLLAGDLVHYVSLLQVLLTYLGTQLTLRIWRMQEGRLHKEACLREATRSSELQQEGHSPSLETDKTEEHWLVHLSTSPESRYGPHQSNSWGSRCLFPKTWQVDCAEVGSLVTICGEHYHDLVHLRGSFPDHEHWEKDSRTKIKIIYPIAMTVFSKIWTLKQCY